MYENPKCECGEELEFDNNIDLWGDGDTITVASCGHCPKCGKKYKWFDHYTLSHWDNLKEDK